MFIAAKIAIRNPQMEMRLNGDVVFLHQAREHSRNSFYRFPRVFA
jgi:hypothetical protein